MKVHVYNDELYPVYFINKSDFSCFDEDATVEIPQNVYDYADKTFKEFDKMQYVLQDYYVKQYKKKDE